MTYLGKVLVIDDGLDDRLMLAEDLRRERWLVETAPTGPDAVDAAIKHQPDIVIATLPLPEPQALGLARTLRSCIEHDAVIVALASPQVHPEARAAGFDEAFAKPIDVAALHAFLASQSNGTVSEVDGDRATTKMNRLS